MKKIFRKVIAIVLSLAMVMTTFAFSSAKVGAATLSNDEIDSIAGYGTMQNMVLNSSAIAYPGVAEGNIENLTNGNFSGHCALSSGWGYSGEAYAIVDLGNIYKSDSLDEIICTYKDYADNDTVVGRTYNIQYSDDMVNWDTVYTSETIDATDLEDSKATVNDVSGFDGRVRYIKIDYPSVPTYGIQLTEIAVLAEDPEEAPVEQCADPAEVTASSKALGQITFNITAGEDQEGYVYSANLDSPNGQLLNATCQAGVDYTYDVVGGDHTVFVQSHFEGAISPGIYSDQVTVNTYATKVTDSTWNYAYQKTFTLDSGSSTEGDGSVTDGEINDYSYSTASKGSAGSWFTIDLGDKWKAKSFETIAVWFRSNVAGTYPEDGGMKFQYSTDGENFTDVATLTQSDLMAQKGSQVNPFLITGDVSGLSSGAVRYVRVYFPDAVAYGAQVTEIGVYDIDGDAELAPDEPPVDPDNYKYSYVSYYEEFPDSNDNGANLVTQEGATVEGVTATASADDASYVIDADPNTIWNASGDDTQWITVDLGEVKTVKEIDCRWAEDNTAKAYTVMVSTYGNEFQPVATVDNDSFYDNRRDMIVLGESISTRYIKIEMTGSHLPEGYSLREMAVYDDSNYVGIVDYLNKVNTTENLAYKKTPIVARYNNEGQARRYCDGNLNTGWRANKPTDNSWFAIDLKDYYNIEDVMVCWSDANAVDYDIYAGRIPDWYGDEPVASVRGLWDNKSVSAVTKDLNVKARYIKIEVEEWSENSERDGIQPLEIAVFGEKAEGYYNIRDYKWVWPWQYPTMEGKIFAGWFTDETLTEPYMDEDGYAYPRFIDKDILGPVKFQEATDGSAIRFLSSIDKVKYQEAGFIISGHYGEHEFKGYSKPVRTLYKSVLESGEPVYPTIFSDDSKYFFTFTVGGFENFDDLEFSITPYIITEDDTKVIGETGVWSNP